jgi:hypothetical protein
MADTFDLHIRHNGQSHDLNLSDLSLTSESSNSEIIESVAGLLDLQVSEFSGATVRRNEGQVTIAPEAVYG